MTINNHRSKKTTYNFPEFTEELLPPLSTVKHLTAILPVTDQTLYDWRRTGTGPRSYKIEGSLMYVREDVLDWFRTEMESQI